MIGLYGGTFNPIHSGHLRAAEEVVEALDLDRMVFIPNARPPHKEDPVADWIAPPRQRLEWVELAIRDNPRFAVDAIEVERPGPSYLVDTLREIGRREQASGRDGELVFVVGQDAFAEMGTWRAPRELFRICHIAVTTRPPIQQGHLAEWLPEVVRRDVEVMPDGRSARHRETGTWVKEIAITSLDISASAIRARLREGRSVRYLLPNAVLAAIEASGCYTAASLARGAHADGPTAEGGGPISPPEGSTSETRT